MELPEEIRKQIEEVIKEHPEMVEQYGNPLDPDDPRWWTASQRIERGLSTEELIRYLSKDVELITLTLGKVMHWQMREEERQMKEKLREAFKDPEKAAELLADLLKGTGLPIPDASFGPDGDDGHAYAGSAHGIAPDTIVETVDGPIRADQIPGYREDSEWRPSPDWSDANCTCPAHVAERELLRNRDPFSDDEDKPRGMYL